ncbi:16S rRNA (guanine(527)-N(7))-methyltransferase RsmG [Celeribacter persicus]|uniref:Ribosomal RNA small subunit methyltransferase G n=1 Tax=Celeribacter persicus TaxID=1651082 RepID=A0A2T5HDN4_9RHOB|nr:16S rRNA (guanine(527)-N(7))-methyltransferase RsmG [Celeribacter persicus]PTQ69694.1 16S rRNA m(7)G-527 methyltransferase [Celeribacter persicus]
MQIEKIAGLDVSRETLERLESYLALLKKWNPVINLVSKSTLEQAWQRHFVDSVQIFSIAPKGLRHWADFGSGGGFPGLVCAVLAKELSPEIRFTLIESDQRKATFLRTVARKLELDVDVRSQRIEQVAPLHADLISARALASLSKLLGFAERHMGQGGHAIFMKGISFREEISESLESWRFSYEEYPSVTDPESVILLIGDIERV